MLHQYDQSIYNSLIVEETLLKDIHPGMKTILKETVQALENEDTVLLADILEYDLKPLVSKFLPFILKIEEKLTSKDI